MRRRILIGIGLGLGPIAFILGLAAWLRADLFWPPVMGTDTVHVLENVAAVQFQCVRQTREIWADVTLFAGGRCLSSACTRITDTRVVGRVDPFTGDIVVRTRIAYTYLPETDPSAVCTTDCGGGLLGGTFQIYLGRLTSGVHQVWLGDAWLGSIDVLPPPLPADQSCLRLWYPVLPTPPPTYTPFVPTAAPYPAPTSGTFGGYP